MAQITQGWTHLERHLQGALEQCPYGTGHPGADRGRGEVTSCEANRYKNQTGKGSSGLGTLSVEKL